MPKVEFKRVQTDAEVENIDIKDGQLIYSKSGKTYMDYGSERIPTGSGGGGGSTEVYIQDTEPTEEDWKIWIDSDKQTDNTYYNDNGTPTNIKTTTYDTLPVGTEVDYDGNTVPAGWTEVDDTTTGNFTLNSNVASGYIQYAKVGKFVQVQANFILNSSAISSGTWKTIILGTVPSGFEPKIETNILARRDTGGQMYIFQIATDGQISIKDRGTGNLQASESIVCNGFYITV